jgi:hypothetical protein
MRNSISNSIKVLKSQVRNDEPNERVTVVSGKAYQCDDQGIHNRSPSASGDRRRLCTYSADLQLEEDRDGFIGLR